MVREREPMGMGGEELMAGLGVIDVIIGLGWARPCQCLARLGTSTLGWALLVGASRVLCVCVCVCVCV